MLILFIVIYVYNTWVLWKTLRFMNSLWSNWIFLLLCSPLGEVSNLNESALVQCDPEMSLEDQELLRLYHHSFDDQWVDLELIMNLLHNICSNTSDGKYQDDKATPYIFTLGDRLYFVLLKGFWAIILQSFWRSFFLWTLSAFTLILSSLMAPDDFQRKAFCLSSHLILNCEPFNHKKAHNTYCKNLAKNQF